MWDHAIFARYIRNPRKIIPGTTMPFNGLKGDQDVADLIAYLDRFSADGQRIN
jgi:cytochrome c